MIQRPTAVMFKRILPALCLAFATLTSAQVPAAGALTVETPGAGGWGYRVGYASQAKANRVALNKCGARCSVVVTFKNTRPAYAGDGTAGSTVLG
ncbi:MAG: DUF4189 domain-containing protein [Pseudomonadota bacterium]